MSIVSFFYRVSEAAFCNDPSVITFGLFRMLSWQSLWMVAIKTQEYTHFFYRQRCTAIWIENKKD